MPVHKTTSKSLDLVIALSGAMLNRAKHYLAEGEQPPKGVRVQEGKRGGKFFEMGGGGGGKPEEEAGGAGQPQEEAGGAGPYKKNDWVVYSAPTLHGPEQRRGMVDFVRPDGRIEVRDNNGGIHIFSPDEVKPKQAVKPEFQAVADHKPDLGKPDFRGQHPMAEVEHWEKELAMSQRRLELMGHVKAPLADVMYESKKREAIQERLTAAQRKAKAGGQDRLKPASDSAALGPKAQAAVKEAEGLFGKLKSGQLDNPQEFVDAARRAVQVYEQEKDEIGPSANPKRAALQQSVERDEATRDRAKELAGKWRDRYAYAKQKGVPGEELDAVKGRMEQAGKEFLQANVRYGESSKALASFDQPKPAAKKPARPRSVREQLLHPSWERPAQPKSSPKQAFQQHQQRPLFGPSERDKPENVAAQQKRMEEAAARHRARQQPGNENKAGLSIG